MIAGIFHKGSGLGNQLFRYVATRVLALDKGYKFAMVAPTHFKGVRFMNLDMDDGIFHYNTDESGKTVADVDLPLWEEKTDYYNPEFNFVEDNTIVDGEFQDPRYFEHRLKEIDEWLKVESLEVPDDLCIIGFRGGEYSQFPDLFLPQSYWDKAIEEMKKINPYMRFRVVTDDPITACEFFPNFIITHQIDIDWRLIRYAKHAIIANSSFYILPRLLSGGFTVAPRYWARHNTKTWAMSQNYYKQFKYI